MPCPSRETPHFIEHSLSTHPLLSPFYYCPSIFVGQQFPGGSGCLITEPFYHWDPFIPLHLANMNSFFQNWSSHFSQGLSWPAFLKKCPFSLILRQFDMLLLQHISFCAIIIGSFVTTQWLLMENNIVYSSILDLSNHSNTYWIN